MKEWKASIAYDSKNTIRLSKTLQNTFHFWQKVLLMAFSVVVAAAGLAVGANTPEGLLMLALGCIMLVNTDMSARARARHTLSQLRGYIPRMEYTFGETSFRGTTDREDNTFSYSTIIRLVDDRKFLYLFQNKESAFMVDKATVEPKGCGALKEHIAKQVGLQWTYPGNLFNTGLLTLLGNRINTRRNDQSDKK